MTKTVKMFVACRNANGEADMFVCDIKVTDAQYNNGDHYDFAEALADIEGYEEPYISFDPHEQANLARSLSELNTPIPFTLNDLNQGIGAPHLAGKVLIGKDGVSISVTDQAGASSNDDSGVIVYMEHYCGHPVLRAYADINHDEPTEILSFDLANA